LKYAVETVRRQDCGNWEIVVSDNCSDQDIQGFVITLADPRITYLRTAAPVAVTDNWNNALNASTGDYVVMLGDDDGLLPRYFTTAVELIQRFDEPDMIYAAALLYGYPGAFPGFPDGFVHTHPGVKCMEDADEPFELDERRRLEFVKRFVNFHMAVNCNMQHSLISRRLVDAMLTRGDFFQSPFPDYYATNSCLLLAERVVMYPLPLVAIGISPKSYGFFHFNQRESEGISFLGGSPSASTAQGLRRTIVPGTNINTSWLYAAETMKENFGRDFDLKVGYRRYRKLQVWNAYWERYRAGGIAVSDLISLSRSLRAWERAFYGVRFLLFLIRLRLLPRQRRLATASRLYNRLIEQYPELKFEMIDGQFDTMLDVYACAERFSA
jgi:glycosyltransferase involved in cell wall biosynthesis